MNTAECRTTKKSAYKLMFGRRPHSIAAPLILGDAAMPADLVDEAVLEDLPHGELGDLGAKVHKALSSAKGPAVQLRRLGVSGAGSNCAFLSVLTARNAALDLGVGVGISFRQTVPEQRGAVAAQVAAERCDAGERRGMQRRHGCGRAA